MCLTLVFLAMRAVMDIGGSCAEGGPYVVSTRCPEGSTLALLGGIVAGFGCGFLATLGGVAVGGIWAAAPAFAWSGLFGSLGWNFLDYGVFSAPDTGIDLGWALCGVVFWAMALGPLLGVVSAIGAARSRVGRDAAGRRSAGSSAATVLGGPGQPAHRPVVIRTSASPVVVTRDGHAVASPGTVVDGDIPGELRAQIEALERQLAAAGTSAGTGQGREELAHIAADFGAAIGAAMAEAPMASIAGAGPGPAASVAPAISAADEPSAAARPAGTAAADEPLPEPVPQPEFTEGTQALLDRLERLADMRDRGLLAPEEYDTAKARIMAELEERS